MLKITITEALAEVKLIDKKVAKKKEIVLSNVVRARHAKDPFERDGGSEQYLTREIQAITDLERRKVKLREAISTANLNNSLTIGERTDTIHNWIVWKREIAKSSGEFAKQIHVGIKSHMTSSSSKPQVYQDDEGKQKIVEWVYGLDYPIYIAKDQQHQSYLDELDGKLSLLNARIEVEV